MSSASTWYSRLPGVAERIARTWASLEIWAARRITAISVSSLKSRMSFTSARTSRICTGAVTPVRTRARTVLSHPAIRRSQAGSAPTGVCSASWFSINSGKRASSSE